MFYLNNKQQPAKKVSGTIKSVDGFYKVDYCATPAREVFRCYTDGELVADIYVNVSIMKELQIQTENVQVSGDYEMFLPVTGYGSEDDSYTSFWNIADYVEDKKAKGNTKKITGWDYEPLELDGQYDHLINLDNYESIEDFIYKTRSLADVVRDSQLDLAWVKKKNYRIVRSREDIMEWLAGLDAYDTDSPGAIPVGFDTETSGLECNRTKRDILVGICMSYEDHGGVYFPLQHLRMDNIEMPVNEFLELLKPYCHKGSPKAKGLITHNGKFDWGVMKMYGWELNIVHDTLTRQAILNIGGVSNAIKLKKIAKEKLGYDVVELSDLYSYPSLNEIKAIQGQLNKGLQCNTITKRKVLGIEASKEIKDLMDFRFAEEDFVELYGPADADFPRLIYQATQADWDKEEGALDFIYNIEVALISMLGEQEYFGVKVQKEEFERLYNDATAEMKELEQEIFEIAGKEFKIGGAETVEVVHDICLVPYHPRYRTKTGNRSVDKHALEYYGQFKNKDGSAKYPIISKLQRYNKLKTLVSSFYGKLPKLVKDGYIFPNYNNIKAETGRLTCSNPNIQQTEPESRKYMLAREGKYLMICDYSQVEYRLMNGLAHEKGVIDFFRNDKEADYHIKAYSNMHGIPYAKVTSKQRKEGKQLNFGTSYGLQDKALALNLYGDDNEAAQKKAHAARTQYFDGVPRVRDYFEEQRDIAQQTHFARTLLGRKRYIKFFAEAESAPNDRKREMLIAKGRRVAGNMPVQGLAADIMKLAMIRIRAIWRKYTDKYAGSFGFVSEYEENARAVLNVHDEVCVEVSKTIHPHIAIMIMREAMEMDLSKVEPNIPPLYVGGNVGYNWYDGKADELEAPVDLMDRMAADARKHLEEGIEYEYLEDPKKFWGDAITRYNLEVLKTQSDIGYEDPDTGLMMPIHNVDDALNSVRIAKYATHYGNKGNYILGLVLATSDDFVWKNLDALLASDAFALKQLNRASDKYLNDYDGAKNSKVLRACAEYYGDFGGNVLNHVVKGHQIASVKVDKKSVDITDTDGSVFTYTDKLSLKTVKEVSKGFEVDDDFKSVEDLVNDIISFRGTDDIVFVKGSKLSVQALSLVLDMMIPVQNLRAMPNIKESDKLSVSLDMGTSEGPKHVAGKVLIKDFVEFAKETVLLDITDGNLKDVENKIFAYKF